MCRDAGRLLRQSHILTSILKNMSLQALRTFAAVHLEADVYGDVRTQDAAELIENLLDKFREYPPSILNVESVLPVGVYLETQFRERRTATHLVIESPDGSDIEEEIVFNENLIPNARVRRDPEVPVKPAPKPPPAVFQQLQQQVQFFPGPQQPILQPVPPPKAHPAQPPVVDPWVPQDPWEPQPVAGQQQQVNDPAQRDQGEAQLEAGEQDEGHQEEVEPNPQDEVHQEEVEPNPEDQQEEEELPNLEGLEEEEEDLAEVHAELQREIENID